MTTILFKEDTVEIILFSLLVYAAIAIVPLATGIMILIAYAHATDSFSTTLRRDAWRIIKWSALWPAIIVATYREIDESSKDRSAYLR